jgi:hypothetical protein
MRHYLFICSLLDDTVGDSKHTAPNIWATVNSELERI